MTAFLVILAIGVGTYAMRVSMFLLASARPVPVSVEQALRFVAPAAVAALVAGRLFTVDGAAALRPLAEIVAVAVAFVVVRRTGNLLHAFAFGLPIYWVLSAATG